MFFKKKIDFHSLKKIAIVRRNGLGDLLCAFPLIIYLQRHFPRLEITLFVDGRNAPLLPYLPSVDQIVVFPKKGNKYWNIFISAWKYRKKFDLALSAKTSPMKLMNVFLYFLRPIYRIAYTNSSWHSRLINYPLFYDAASAKAKHQSLKTLQLVDETIDSVSQHYYPKLSIEKGKREQCKKYIEEQFSFFDKDQPLLLISASTNGKGSRLSEERYADFLNKLAKDRSFQVIIISESKDLARAQGIAALLTMNHIVQVPKNFDEFILYLSCATHFFVGDGGVAHISAALQKPSLVLYGSVSPDEWSPLYSKANVLFHPTDVNLIPETKISHELDQLLASR